jgi:hypothetical protein
MFMIENKVLILKIHAWLSLSSFDISKNFQKLFHLKFVNWQIQVNSLVVTLGLILCHRLQQILYIGFMQKITDLNGAGQFSL